MNIYLFLGPFSSQEMNNWFTAGYFTMSLHVRRVCDAHMLPLGKIFPQHCNVHVQ